MLPPTTGSPGRLSTGSGSPVSIDSSTADSPSATRPSTGMRSPGRTATRSPIVTWAIGISASTPSRSTRAVLGRRPISLRIAPPVRPLVRDSIILPSLIRVMMTAEVSK